MDANIVDKISHLLNEEKWTRAAIGSFSVSNFEELDSIIKEIADYEGYPIIDLYYKSGVNDANLPTLCYDQYLHPNERGMQLIANMIYPEMEKLVR